MEPGLDRPQDCVWVALRVQGVKPSQRLPHRPPPTVNHGFINHSDVYAAVAHFCIWAVVSANQNFNLFPPSWLANRLKLSRQDPCRSKGSHLRYKKKDFCEEKIMKFLFFCQKKVFHKKKEGL